MYPAHHITNRSSNSRHKLRLRAPTDIKSRPKSIELVGREMVILYDTQNRRGGDGVSGGVNISPTSVCISIISTTAYLSMNWTREHESTWVNYHYPLVLRRDLLM